MLSSRDYNHFNIEFVNGYQEVYHLMNLLQIKAFKINMDVYNFIEVNYDLFQRVCLWHIFYKLRKLFSFCLAIRLTKIGGDIMKFSFIIFFGQLTKFSFIILSLATLPTQCRTSDTRTLQIWTRSQRFPYLRHPPQRRERTEVQHHPWFTEH